MEPSMRLPRMILFYGLSVSALNGQGEKAEEISYLSAADDTMQPARFFDPKAEAPTPMVVALHSWSGDYSQQTHQEIELWCVQNGWAFMHPNFRGRNRRPEATGSELAVKDIVSAVAYAKRATQIDEDRVYLVGTSGGGYSCLLMAGRHPKLWAGVSAWVPIYDLEAWYYETRERELHYTGEIVASVGGAPGESRKVDFEYRKRSPKTYMKRARGVWLHINAGIRDGREGSVPISHSLLAFNAVAKGKDRLRKDEIDYFVEEAEVPSSLIRNISDPSYGDKQPLFRRTSGLATVTIFDGAHELIAPAAIAWIVAVDQNQNN